VTIADNQSGNPVTARKEKISSGFWYNVKSNIMFKKSKNKKRKTT